LSQSEIKVANAAGVVGCQADADSVVNVGPFRVVIHGLRSQGDARHESKGNYKGIKQEGFAELAVNDLEAFGRIADKAKAALSA